MRRLLPLLLVAATPAQLGCEGCDFTFGPIPVNVHVTPIDAGAEVTLCAEDQGCHTETAWDGVRDAYGAGPRGPDGRAITPGSARFLIGWRGYAQCKHPRLTVRVEADSCEPVELHRDRQRPKGADTIELHADLDCAIGSEE